MVEVEPSVAVSDLSVHESWIPVIAAWHHEEWLKTYEGKSRSVEVAAEKLIERQQSLGKHLVDAPIPSTFVANIGGAPVGTVSLVYYHFTKDSRPTEWLTNLFVVPEYRRLGIASALLRFAIGHANRHGVARLLLYTSDQMAFYRKRRWRSINRGIVQGQKVEIMDYILRPD